MRFAIKTRPEHQTWEELRDIWVAADELPLFESAWNWDHFYPLTGDLAGPNFEAWTMLGRDGHATRRIRIGCQVTGMIYRHPAVLANMAATVDIISGGRLELGIGAGWNQMECDAYGIPLPPLKERFDRFDEGVEAIVLLLSEPVSTTSPASTSRSPTRAASPSRCSARTRRSPSAARGRTAHAAHRRPVGAAVELARPRRGRRWLELKDVLAGHCAAIGRDVSEITCSVNVRFDQRHRARGRRWTLGLAGRGRRPGHRGPAAAAKPDLLAPLADALAQLG